MIERMKNIQWEYAELIWEKNHDILLWSEPPWIIQHRRGKRYKNWYEIWYEIGQSGWELITNHNSIDGVYYYFKRQTLQGIAADGYLPHPQQGKLF